MVLAAAWGLVVAGAGGLLTDLSPWYYTLRNPKWKPPDWAFGPVWTVILGLGSYAAYLGWEAAPTAALRYWMVSAYIANGVLNMAWSLLFFKMRRPDLALFEVPLLWLSILAIIVVLAQIDAVAAWMLSPYLAWVTVASFLNRAIVTRNRPFAGRVTLAAP